MTGCGVVKGFEWIRLTTDCPPPPQPQPPNRNPTHNTQRRDPSSLTHPHITPPLNSSNTSTTLQPLPTPPLPTHAHAHRHLGHLPGRRNDRGRGSDRGFDCGCDCGYGYGSATASCRRGHRHGRRRAGTRSWCSDLRVQWGKMCVVWCTGEDGMMVVLGRRGGCRCVGGMPLVGEMPLVL
jgi:hypothetical protein